MQGALKIAMICGVPEHGNCGVYDYTTELARRLGGARQADRWYEPVLFVNAIGNARRRRDLETAEIPFRESRSAWNLAGVGRLSKSVKEGGCRVAHVMYPSRGYGRSPWVSLLPLFLRLRAPRVRLLVTLHEFRRVHPLRRLASLPLILLADVLHVTTEEERRFVNRRIPGTAAKTRVMRLGPNISPPSSRRATPGFVESSEAPGFEVEDPPWSIVYFGIVRRDKGLPCLLRAFASALVEAPRRTRLLVIGEPAVERRLRREVRLLVDELDLDAHMSWESDLPAPDVSRRLKEADLCVLPFTDGASFRRGSLIAAISHGLPVITTRSLDTPRELVHGENVWLVAPEDPEELAGAIRLLMAEEDTRRRIGANAERLARLFDWDARVAELSHVYEELSG